MSALSLLADILLAADVNITYVSGTCKKTVPTFNMSTYYNQDSILVKDMNGVNVSSSSWDLGKDGAFSGYNVMYCGLTPTTYGGYLPTAVLQLIQQKGFNVTQSCNMAGLLAYPAFHVFILIDRTESVVISDADANAVAAFYTRGGGLYSLTDNCPYSYNVNLIYSKMPDVLSRFRLWHNDNIIPFPLTLGNPAADNQFGSHVVFTGVPTMSSGHSLSIPFYDGVQGSGVFASLCTVLIQKTPSTCSFEPAASYVRTHAAMMYVDPPTQFVNVADACNWGRIVVDTGWTRYDFAPLRTRSHRLAANIVVYLLNIERCMERTASSGGDGYAPQSCGVPTASSDIAGQTHQVVGCSSGDALTLTSSRSICRISFSGVNAPTCLSIVVTARDSSTCIVDMTTASVGSYWIMVDGHNSSQQMTVTAASLTRRGTVAAVTGTCAKATATLVTGCRDGSSITIDWTLPNPSALTVGFGVSVTMCSEFVVNGTLVYCRLVSVATTPHGTHPVYIDGVPTGIAMKIVSNVAALMHDVCSGTQTETLAVVPPQHSQPTATSATSIVVAGVVWLGVVLGGAGGAAHSIQSAVLLLRMQTLCSEDFASSSVTPDNLCCDLATSPTQLTISSSYGGVYLGSIFGNTLIVVCSTALRYMFGQIIQMQLKTKGDKSAEGSSSILVHSLRVFGALAPPSGPVTLSCTSYMFLLCPTVALCVALVADEATPSYAQWLGVMIVLLWLVPWAEAFCGLCWWRRTIQFGFRSKTLRRSKKAEMHRTFATRACHRSRNRSYLLLPNPQAMRDWLCEPSETLVPRRGTKQTALAAQQLRNFGSVFASYRASRYWCFNVEVAFAIVTGIATGLMLRQMSGTDACAGVGWGWAVLGVGVTELTSALVVQAFTLRLELVVYVLVMLFTTLSEIVALLAPNEGNAANALSIIAAVMQLVSVAYGALEHFRLRRRIEQLSSLRAITMQEPDAIRRSNVVTSIDKRLIAEPRSATKLDYVLRDEDLAAAPLGKRVALSSEAVLGDLVKLICDAQLP